MSPRAGEAVRSALELAGSRPAGAVHLDYDPSGDEMCAPTSPAPPRSADDVVLQATAMLRGASKPVVIVGLEAQSSAGAVLAALERLGCPVLTTYQAIGVVPEGHPQLAGLFTSGSIEAALLREADLILTVGFDQVEPMPTAWRYDVPVIAVSEVPACATLAPITIEVLGPLATDARPGRRLSVLRLEARTPGRRHSPPPVPRWPRARPATSARSNSQPLLRQPRRRTRSPPSMPGLTSWRSCRSGLPSSRSSC